MSQDQDKGKGKREKQPPPSPPVFTPGTTGLFQVKKPVTPQSTQQESEPAMQQDSAVEEKTENTQGEQQNEAPYNYSTFITNNQANVEQVPHSESIPDTNLAGQNVSNQPIQQYGQQASIPLKKSATTPVPQPRIYPTQSQKSQIVERRTVKVTIEIYEDQRREIEAMLTERVNRLIDAGVEVDRRKYQVSVIYTELLDFALSLVKQKKQDR